MDPLGAKSIIHAIQDSRHSQYLTNRETASRALNRNRQWNSNTYRLASKVWQLPTVSIARRAKILRIVWDKHYHGDNRSKDTSLTPAQRQFVQHCPYCYSTNDTQDHWIRLCTAPGLPAIRTKLKADLQEYAQSQHPRIRPTVEHIVSQALDSPDGYKIWIGLWTPEARESLTTHITQISPKPKPGPIHAQILAVMQRCSQAVDLLWHTRSQLPLHTDFLHHLRTDHPSLLHRYRGTRPRPTRVKNRPSNALVVAPSRNPRCTARRPR